MESSNILLLSFEFPPYPLAGTGFYAYNLVKSLEGHNVTLLTPNHSGHDQNPELPDNVQIKRIPMTSFNLFNKLSGQTTANRSFIDRKTLFAMKVRNSIKKELNLNDYDLFHSLNERDAAFLDLKYMNQFFPTIISVNDYYILGASANPLKFHFKSTDLPLRYAHHNLMKRFYTKKLQQCTKIVPNCHFVSKIIQQQTGVPPEKIRVIHRGIDTKKFNIAPAKNKYENRKILFVGPNAERKGALYLLQAAPSILQEYPETTFTFIGSCPWRYKKKLFSFIEQHNLKNKITYFEHLPQDQLLNYYQEANVFIMPSIMEALGQVYLEAMTTRTPVIGANVGGVSEIITEDVGFLVPPQNPAAIAEKVITLFSDEDLARTLGEAGHKRAIDNFSIERQMKETLDLYKSLL